MVNIAVINLRLLIVDRNVMMKKNIPVLYRHLPVTGLMSKYYKSTTRNIVYIGGYHY